MYLIKNDRIIDAIEYTVKELDVAVEESTMRLINFQVK